ncbi:hypothetical protein IE53DRAFT_274456 [Violaceomyces palustris]|uniref:Uncharacterized protein n=1 Tax=Violaceomyces palustris TaxID=1673888 RepID=A0ACD0P3G9_9BASI|nr:hypothetical protein IE53DRAFT_274456 [Violaceomyces palustris]
MAVVSNEDRKREKERERERERQMGERRRNQEGERIGNWRLGNGEGSEKHGRKSLSPYTARRRSSPSDSVASHGRSDRNVGQSDSQVEAEEAKKDEGESIQSCALTLFVVEMRKWPFG